MSFIFTTIYIDKTFIISISIKIKMFLKKYSYRVTVLVSKSTHVTSVGGSYKSKNLESTPIKNGNGACKTSAKLNGHNGIYGHCHLKGKMS